MPDWSLFDINDICSAMIQISIIDRGRRGQGVHSAHVSDVAGDNKLMIVGVDTQAGQTRTHISTDLLRATDTQPMRGWIKMDNSPHLFTVRN